MRLIATLGALKSARDSLFLSRRGARGLAYAYAGAGALLVLISPSLLREPIPTFALTLWCAGLVLAFWAALERRPSHWFYWAFFPWMLCALSALPLGGWAHCSRMGAPGAGGALALGLAGTLLAVAAGGAFAGIVSAFFNLNGLPLAAAEILIGRIVDGAPAETSPKGTTR